MNDAVTGAAADPVTDVIGIGHGATEIVAGAVTGCVTGCEDVTP